MKQLINIIIILSVVVTCSFAHAGEEPLESTYALDLINQIRSNPLLYAQETLGYDQDKINMILNELPWLADVLNKNMELPPACLNSDLNALAEKNNSVAVVQDLQNYTELPEQQAQNPGADFALTGEMGGIVSFYNFMPVEFAWEIIIRNQFVQELKSDMVGQRYILNPGFDLIGRAVRGGVNTVDGIKKNAYFATICFASSRLKAEVQVMNMVNQVRFKPAAVPGIVRQYLNADFSDLPGASYFDRLEWDIYPPLLDSSFVYEYVHEYTQSSLIGEPMVDDTILDGIQITESVSGFSINLESSMDLTSQVAVNVFAGLIQSEVEALPVLLPERKAIFSLGKSHGGIGISFSLENGQNMVSSVLAAGNCRIDTGTDPQADQAGQTDSILTDTRAGIYGIVYFDKDENKIYSPGEGISLACVNVYRQSGDGLENDVIVNQVYTDNAGHFSIYLEKGQEYRFEIFGVSDAMPDQTIPLENIQIVQLDSSLFLPVDLSLVDSSLVPGQTIPELQN